MLFERLEQPTCQNHLTAVALHNHLGGSIPPAKVAHFLTAIDIEWRRHPERAASSVIWGRIRHDAMRASRRRRANSPDAGKPPSNDVEIVIPPNRSGESARHWS